MEAEGLGLFRSFMPKFVLMQNTRQPDRNSNKVGLPFQYRSRRLFHA